MAGRREREFEHILERSGPMLSRIAAIYEFDPALREDLLQDVAVALWHALPTFAGRSSLKTFIARIAHNRGVSHIAREAKRPKGHDPDHALPSPGPGLEEKIVQRQQAERLVGAVQRLPLPLRQVAALALEGFEAREIAEALGLTANNAAVRLNRAKAALKQELAS